MIEYKAQINNVSIDYESGHKIISFLINEGFNEEALNECKGKVLRVSAKPWREKRSLDANSYYWLLLGKLASKIHMSTAELHNIMLCEYGQLEIMNDLYVPVELPDTFEVEHKIRNSETYHLKPTSEVYGTFYGVKRKWLMLRGSHTYNTEEFSRLLQGLIDECETQGIQTITPAEMERMMSAYKEEHR